MPIVPRPSMIKPLLRATRDFFGSFAHYAGVQGWIAGGLVGLGAILDGAGLLLLIPIIDAVVATPGKPSRVTTLLDTAGAHTPFARLAVMLAFFVALSLLRAFVMYARDMALARLQSGFVENLRNGLMRRLAAAPWHRIVALRHARITSLMTSEVARISGSSQYLIQGSVALVIEAQQALANAQDSEVQAMANYTHNRNSFDMALGRTLEVNHISMDEATSGHVARESSIPVNLPPARTPGGGK